MGWDVPLSWSQLWRLGTFTRIAFRRTCAVVCPRCNRPRPQRSCDFGVVLADCVCGFRVSVTYSSPATQSNLIQALIAISIQQSSSISISNKPTHKKLNQSIKASQSCSSHWWEASNFQVFPAPKHITVPRCNRSNACLKVSYDSKIMAVHFVPRKAQVHTDPSLPSPKKKNMQNSIHPIGRQHPPGIPVGSGFICFFVSNVFGSDSNCCMGFSSFNHPATNAFVHLSLDIG